ncbi:MAG: stage III sporulation protein AF [Clostridia bacterium]|nr:stage III sporulation protein AF [Clostridia bacterium]
MAFLNEWMQGIIMAVIIATIIQMILPNGNNKKYIEMVIGIYILFTIISPIISKVSKKDFDLDEGIKNSVKEYTPKQQDEINNDEYIKQLYIQNIKNDIKSKLEVKGYTATQIDLVIKGEEEYILEGVDLKITRTKQKVVDKIDEVKIDISEKEEDNSDILQREDISIIKEYIGSIYDIEENNITINK